jgi:hypothetical protein
MRARLSIAIVLGLFGLLALGAASAAAVPAITVANNNASGAGSLRAAIGQIDLGGTITVPASIGTIGLGGAPLEIEKPMTIAGSGSGQTAISGENLSRVIQVVAKVNVTLSGLQILNGKVATPDVKNAGGGLLANLGSLTLVNCLVTSNTVDTTGGTEGGESLGGGVAALGTAALTLTNTVVADNQVIGGGAGYGGGVYANGPLTITGGAVKGNTAEGTGIEGGGIYYPNNASPGISLTDVSVSGNLAQPRSGKSANGDGGGISIHSGTANTLTNVTINGNTIRADNAKAISSGVRGGGLVIQDGTTAIVNSTITGNLVSANIENLGVAIAGGLLVQGPTTIANTTIAGNTSRGGGTNLNSQGGDLTVFQAGTRVRNSIVAEGSAVTGGGNCEVAEGGSVVSEGGNLDSLNQCGFNAPGDQPNTSAALRPLAENGGPVQTMALQPGSLAIGAGQNCPATDARGVLRPAAACDSGAYEVATPIATTAPATGATTTAAALNGLATNPDLSPGVVYFEYGTSTAYGTRTPERPIGATTRGAGFSATVGGLTAGTTYHFREVVRNGIATVAGPDRSFATVSSSVPVAPSASRPHVNVRALGGLRFKLRCTVGPCRVRFTARARQGRRKVLVLTAKTRLAAGRAKTVSLKLNRAGRRLERHRGKVPLTLKITLAQPGGGQSPVRSFRRTVRP